MKLSRLIGTWFGCGYSPVAPGTAGSLGGLVIAILLVSYAGLSPLVLIAFTAALTPAGIWAAGAIERELGREDPGLVVVDEVLGQWLTAAAIVRPGWRSYVLAFALFRIFDITKPWPIRNLEKLHGGLGIVADDLLAGVYGAVLMTGAAYFSLI
jgi:phosphatidylglycerophosphatase A